MKLIKSLSVYGILCLTVLTGILIFWPVFLLKNLLTVLKRGFLTWAIASAVLFFDLWTKKIAAFRLHEFNPVPVITDILSLDFTRNYGAAFGIMQNMTWLFIAVASGAVFVIFIISSDFSKKPLFLRTGYGFLMGGALGNLYDRLTTGYVIDFINLRPFPIFNLADLAIDIGLGLIFIFILSSEQGESEFVPDLV